MSKPNKGLIDLSRASKPALPTADVVATAPQDAASPMRDAPDPANPASASKEETKAPRGREPRSTVATPAPTSVAEPVSTLGARIPASLHKRVRLFCAEHDVEMQHFVQDALTRHLERLQKGAKAVE